MSKERPVTRGALFCYFTRLHALAYENQPGNLVLQFFKNPILVNTYILDDYSQKFEALIYKTSRKR